MDAAIRVLEDNATDVGFLSTYGEMSCGATGRVTSIAVDLAKITV